MQADNPLAGVPETALMPAIRIPTLPGLAKLHNA
jgi:hypothetical protein